MKRFMLNLTITLLSITLGLLSAENAFSQTDEAVQSANDGDSPTYVSGLTPARARSLVNIVIGLTSVVIGWRIKSASDKATGGIRRWAIVALVLGGLAIILSVLRLAGSTRAFGTGGGKAGAIVALVLGVVGMIVNGLALRSRVT
jgi:hypothetical protein